MATIETEFSDEALMIDTETLALGPNAFVTQVGFCIANLRTREYLHEPFNFWLTESGQEGRHMDLGTIAWWMGQSQVISASVFTPPDGQSRSTPTEVFDFFKQTFDLNPHMTVWASPSSFDHGLLTSLWGRKPWSYRQERDMMTLYKLLDPKGILAPPENEAAHNAAADARWQMDYLFALIGRLRSNSLVA